MLFSDKWGDSAAEIRCTSDAKPSLMRLLSGRKRILFVDDDPTFLRGLEAVFRNYRERWEMVFVGGVSGLVALRESTFDVVVSGFKMSGLDGAVILASAKQSSPAAVRILLTGSAVDASRIDAHMILAKPYRPGELRRAIEDALPKS